MAIEEAGWPKSRNGPRRRACVEIHSGPPYGEAVRHVCRRYRFAFGVSEGTPVDGKQRPTGQYEKMSGSNLTWAQVSKYVMAKPGATEEFPFGPDDAVFKVCGKIFAFIAWGEVPLRMSLKCDPLEAELLRRTYASIVAPRYLNKRLWITVTLDESVPRESVCRWIDDSYSLVLAGLPRYRREQLASGAA